VGSAACAGHWQWRSTSGLAYEEKGNCSTHVHGVSPAYTPGLYAHRNAFALNPMGVKGWGGGRDPLSPAVAQALEDAYMM